MNALKLIADETEVIVIPDERTECQLQVNNEIYSVRNHKGMLSVSVTVPSVAVLNGRAQLAPSFPTCEAVDAEAEDEGKKRTCIVCNGRYY